MLLKDQGPRGLGKEYMDGQRSACWYHQKHLQQSRLTNQVEKMIPPGDVSQPLSSVTWEQVQSDDGGGKSGGHVWANIMGSLLPRLILQLPQLNIQTVSNRD